MTSSLVILESQGSFSYGNSSRSGLSGQTKNQSFRMMSCCISAVHFFVVETFYFKCL